MAHKISDAEKEVMEVLWENAPLSANEVVESLSSHKKWNDRTIRTLLNRLLKKKAIDYHKKEKKYLYFPLISRQEYVDSENKLFLDRLHGGKVAPFLASFVDQETLDENEIEELRKLLDKVSKND